MRKKPMSGHSHHGGMKRYNNRGQNGGGHGHGHGHGNRPRKNYGALREKYLNQARDALASGDRVLAENYFQHADHYFRMMAEENERRAQWQQSNPQQQGTPEQQEPAYEMNDTIEDVPAAGSLPAFLTQPVTPQTQQQAADAPVLADWEE